MASQPAATSVLNKKRSNGKVRLAISVASAILVGGLGWFGWNKTHPNEESNAKLLTEAAKKGDLVESVSATGSVTAQTGAQVKITQTGTNEIRTASSSEGGNYTISTVTAGTYQIEIVKQGFRSFVTSNVLVNRTFRSSGWEVVPNCDSKGHLNKYTRFSIHFGTDQDNAELQPGHRGARVIPNRSQYQPC